MQNKTIKSLSLALVICLGSAAGFSMHNAMNDCHEESRLAQKPVWGAKITPDQTTVFHHDVNITVSACGKIIDVSGNSNCLGLKEKKYSLQGLELALIMNGLNHQLTPCHVEELITEYEKCPCPEKVKSEEEPAFAAISHFIGGVPNPLAAVKIAEELVPAGEDEIRARNICDLKQKLDVETECSADDQKSAFTKIKHKKSKTRKHK